MNEWTKTTTVQTVAGSILKILYRMQMLLIERSHAFVLEYGGVGADNQTLR